MAKNALSLYELNNKIKQGLEGLFPFSVWVVAEISEISSNKHCYLELIERNEVSDKIIAKIRATIWSYTYAMLKPYFETETGYRFEAGLKVLLNVEVQFSEVYGLSLNVKDIDPNYTLGDMQRRKQLILKQLEKDGVLNMNKSLEFPLVPKTIAIISSEKAAGYQDFVEQLKNNASGYQFHIKLFPALMQGNQATASIMKALEEIYEYESIFDAVVIIRGGGAVSELSCFDEYDLAVHIAQFPLPVLVGIGHDKDKSVVDVVAYESLKTPTAVADYLINCYQDFERAISESSQKLSFAVKTFIYEEMARIENNTYSIKYKLPFYLKDARQNIKTIAKDLEHLVMDRLQVAQNKNMATRNYLQLLCEQKVYKNKDKIAYLERKFKNRVLVFAEDKHKELEHKQRVLALLSPQKLLKRGYSITTYKGKIVKDASLLKKGEELTTYFAKGELKSVIK